MPKNKIDDLRNHLFATIENLLDTDTNFDIQKAKAIADIAQVIVNSAKIEVDFIKATDKSRATTTFFPESQNRLENN